tara:strand:+ start:2818 stop:3105 length:288 start_codon:yes stop_codon:yes gene_type:complete
MARFLFKPTDHADVRHGPGVRWKSETVHGITEGYQVDNLNTKNIDEATSSYERVFITIREALERNDACSMDDERDRLQCCQVIADSLRKSSLIVK